MRTAAIIAIAILASGCGGGGTSTREVRAAAIQHAKQQLRLAPSTALEATTWVGENREGDQAIVCGTVSGTDGSGGIPPQPFAATADPIRWLIFEEAHDAMEQSQPDKFPEWRRLCGSNTAAS